MQLWVFKNTFLIGSGFLSGAGMMLHMSDCLIRLYHFKSLTENCNTYCQNLKCSQNCLDKIFCLNAEYISIKKWKSEVLFENLKVFSSNVVFVH